MAYSALSPLPPSPLTPPSLCREEGRRGDRTDCGITRSPPPILPLDKRRTMVSHVPMKQVPDPCLNATLNVSCFIPRIFVHPLSHSLFTRNASLSTLAPSGNHSPNPTLRFNRRRP